MLITLIGAGSTASSERGSQQLQQEKSAAGQKKNDRSILDYRPGRSAN
jgi:hypothetical protein